MSGDGLRGMNLNSLVALDALLAEESVTRAAGRLGVTQSAMSHTLRQLREQVGDPLLVKGPRGMTLTPRAQQMMAPLRRGLAELGRAMSAETAFELRTTKRTFTIAAGDFFAVQFLPDLIAIVGDEAPGVDLVIRPPDARRDARRLEAGDIDLLVTVPRPDSASLRSRRLFVETFTCLVREGHPEVRGVMSLEAYVRLPHLLISPSGGGTSYVDTALASHGLARRVSLRVPYFLAAPMVIARSNLVLTAPRRVAESFARQLPLVLMPPPLELASFAVHAVWHERDEHDPAHAWLRGALGRAAEQSDVTSPATPRRDRGRTARTRSARDR